MQKFGLLVSEEYVRRFDRELAVQQQQCRQEGVELDLVVVPTAKGAEKEVPFAIAETVNTLPANVLERVDAAYVSEDLQFDWRSMRYFLGSAEASPRLAWLQISWIGLDFPILDGIKRRKEVSITNASGTNALPIATSVLAAILALNRGLHQWVEAKVQRKWMNRETIYPRRDIVGQRTLIYGFGSIGQTIGQMCKSVGMHVTGVRRSKQAADGVTSDKMLLEHDLCRALPEVDILIIAAPLTEHTKDKFGHKMLSLLPSNAIVVNVGRGQVVDEVALAQLLKDKKLAGAYLDVFATEPLPESSLLWELPNVILSPHDSASCIDNAKRVQTIFESNLFAFARGVPLQHVVRPAQATSKL